MRVILMSLMILLPCPGAIVAPQTPQTSRPTPGRSIRISLINMSGRRRQLLLKSGILNLPQERRIDIDSYVGSTLHVMSDIDANVNEDIYIYQNDRAHLINVL
jgi:hypothetical protein